MTIEAAKQLLVNTINSRNGLKAMEIVAIPDVVGLLSDHNVPQLLEDLVKENRLVEIEYALPDMDWRLKSFYLPAGTTVNVLGAVGTRKNNLDDVRNGVLNWLKNQE